MKHNRTPKVKIDTCGFAENRYSLGDKYWNAAGLVQWCKDKKYPVFKLPLAGIRLEMLPFNVGSLDEFIWQCKRVNNASLEYPILLDDYGRICDGYHRVCKAILEGRRYVKAIRIQTMPTPDGYEMDTKNN